MSEKTNLEQKCSHCGVILLTESEILKKYPSNIFGQWQGTTSEVIQMQKDRNRIGVTCVKCGANFCSDCMVKNAKPHSSSGGLACLKCGGRMTQFKRNS